MELVYGPPRTGKFRHVWSIFFSQDGSRDFASDAEVRTLLREGAVELLVGFRRGVGWHHLVNTRGFFEMLSLIEKEEQTEMKNMRNSKHTAYLTSLGMTGLPEK